MVASRRERIIGLLTAGVLAVLALDRLALSPLMERRERLAEEVGAARLEIEENNRLFTNDKRMARRWSAMLTGGLKADVPEAEAQALHALRDWAQEAGLGLTSLKPERVETQKQFQIVTVRATANGSLRSMSEFLWRVQTADIPLRVTDMQVSSRKDGTDDLTLQLGVSTLCLAPPPASQTPGGAKRAGPSVASAGSVRDSFVTEVTQ